MTLRTAFFPTPLSVGIFATKGAGKTDFDRLKENLRVLQELYRLHFEEANGTTLKLETARFIASRSRQHHTLKVKRRTSRSSRRLKDRRREGKEWSVPRCWYRPTEAKIFIGSGGYQLCDFIMALRTANVYRYDYEQVIADKEKLPRNTKSLHKSTRSLWRAKGTLPRGLGPSNAVRTQFGKSGVECWSRRRAGEIAGDYELRLLTISPYLQAGTLPRRKTKCADGRGLDEGTQEVQNPAVALAMRGDDYTDQSGDRAKELSKYKRDEGLRDATGVGDPVVDNFKRSTRLRTEPVKFPSNQGQSLQKPDQNPRRWTGVPKQSQARS